MEYSNLRLIPVFRISRVNPKRLFLPLIGIAEERSPVLANRNYVTSKNDNTSSGLIKKNMLIRK